MYFFHDERDFIFAKKYDLPIKVVISPDGSKNLELNEAFTGNGIQINSNEFNGLNNNEGKKKIANLIEDKGFGEKTITYHEWR